MSLILWAGTDGTRSLLAISLLAHAAVLPPVAITGSESDMFKDSFTASSNWFTAKEKWCSRSQSDNEGRGEVTLVHWCENKFSRIPLGRIIVVDGLAGHVGYMEEVLPRYA